MEWARPVEQLIRERRSCRTFDEREIGTDKLEKLKIVLRESSADAKDIPARFALIDSADTGGRVGTYGMITGARSYIVGITEKGKGRAEDFGYAFEKIILFATGLDIGTCWLAGIDRKTFESKLDLTENEAVAVASPVGYARAPRMKEGLIRMVVRADKRKPFEQIFFEGGTDRPLTNEKAGGFAGPLQMARLAPSASNKQPWRVILDGRDLHFCLERSKGYKDGQFPIDIQKNDVGIAMCHFELAGRAEGLAGGWTDVPNAPAGGFEYVRTWREP